MLDDIIEELCVTNFAIPNPRTITVFRSLHQVTLIPERAGMVGGNDVGS